MRFEQEIGEKLDELLEELSVAVTQEEWNIIYSKVVALEWILKSRSALKGLDLEDN